jgi:very-short-patch-repair endonuclease
MQAQAGPLARLFGPVWQGADSDWEELGGVLDWADEARSILDRVPGVGLTSRHETRAAWVRFATEGRAQVAAGTPFASGAASFRQAMLSFGQARLRLDQLLQLDEVAAWGSAESPGFLERTRQMLDSLAAHMPRLRDWTHYQAARATASRARLGPLVDAFERGEITGPELVEIFEHSFADGWGRRILRSIPSLAAFHGTGHDEKIEAFRALEDRVASLCRQEVFARLASRLPRPNEEDRGLASETGLLRRYAQGGRKTIRRVFKDCPKALARFKPCMLLSPLSVATVLGKDFPKFDIVVFDEASQLPTHEAIGAIARGHHLVVVGDSKQLPPTTFFERQSAGEDGEDEDEGEELDSILEEAVAAGFRSLSLDWHYRSRHELLIAFSNHQFYGNNLLTFPSAMDKDDRLGVRWIPVPDGVYEHGGNRTNHKEAEAVVAEVVRRLRDPEESKSLGIVTFSMAQQKLVESLLEKERGQCSAINDYFKPGPDSVFVKNLETVQGDERDVILFSICYGPDQNKVTSMNFGPLNRKGGERRLNVAVTRARRLLLVFSTLRAEAINESRTKSDGARHLRVFLKYAEIGVAALTGQTRSSEGGIESPFEQSVFDELTRHGWDVATQVGCSGYRIDLAIRDPEAPGRYLLGIECDGAAYHSAASARDRDCIRQSVLERLGWRLHRIWSTDWLHRRPREIERLVEAIERARVAVQRADREAKERVCCVPVQPEPEPAPEAPRIARRVGRPRRAENEAASAVIAPQRDDRPRKASPAHGIPLDPGHPLAEAIASLLPNADFICQVCGDDRAIIVNWSGPGLQCLSDEGCGKREPVVLDVVSRAVERLGMRCACGAAQRVCSSRTGTFIGCSDYPKCRTAVSWKDYCQQLWDRQGRA